MVMSLLNLPSRADFSRLLTKLEVIQGNLTNLSLKVDRLEAAPRQGFVVHDQCADGHVGCVARSNGIVISSRRPGLEKRTASFCWSP